MCRFVFALVRHFLFGTSGRAAYFRGRRVWGLKDNKLLYYIIVMLQSIINSDVLVEQRNRVHYSTVLDCSSKYDENQKIIF